MRISDWSSDVCSSDLPHAERDVLTSLEWLAGWTALKQSGQPASAITHFDRYSLAAQTPQPQSKRDYWAGRAADAAGQASTDARRVGKGCARQWCARGAPGV